VILSISYLVMQSSSATASASAATTSASTGGDPNKKLDEIDNSEEFDCEGNTVKVENLHFLDGILGQGMYGTVRLARRVNVPAFFSSSSSSSSSSVSSASSFLDEKPNKNDQQRDSSSCFHHNDELHNSFSIADLMERGDGEGVDIADCTAASRTAASASGNKKKHKNKSIKSSSIKNSGGGDSNQIFRRSLLNRRSNSAPAGDDFFKMTEDILQVYGKKDFPNRENVTPVSAAAAAAAASGINTPSTTRAPTRTTSGGSILNNNPLANLLPRRHNKSSSQNSILGFFSLSFGDIQYDHGSNSGNRHHHHHHRRRHHAHDKKNNSDSRVTFDDDDQHDDDDDDDDDAEPREQLVAVKIFRKSILKRMRTMERNKETRRMQVRTALQQVEREIAVMKKLSHPNLVQFYEVIDSPHSDIIYMVIEYMPLGEILSYQKDAGTFKRKTPWHYMKYKTATCYGDDADADDGEAKVEEGLVDGHFDEFHSALYFVDILHGLAYLHQNHIIHRKFESLMYPAV
jgi:serine/threonine protein kinase